MHVYAIQNAVILAKVRAGERKTSTERTRTEVALNL